MSPGPRPEAIDSRLVFRIYGWLTLAIGIVVVSWGPLWLTGPPIEHLRWGGAAMVRLAGAAAMAAGCCALASATIEAPHSRRRVLYGFAAAHLVFGLVLWLQWLAVLDPVLPAAVGWGPMLAGSVLLYLAVTGPSSDFPPPGGGLIDLFGGFHRNHEDLRTTYEQQIRRAARQEERARLARDLHDAVKQQLFVIQTAAATAQVRLTEDGSGARAAIDQVRAAARDASREMQAMLDQLQAAPLGNAGLVESIRAQADALAARTGATAVVDIGALPPDDALDPGAREALYRIVQEAIANIARHARAGRVTVSLGLAGSELILTIRDEGQGFDLFSAQRGMGLANMRARADEAGATLVVDSAPGRGTTVRLALPYYPPSPRDYRNRAAMWAAILVMQAFLVRRVSPIFVAVFVIAAIGLARHLYALRQLRRRHA